MASILNIAGGRSGFPVTHGIAVSERSGTIHLGKVALTLTLLLLTTLPSIGMMVWSASSLALGLAGSSVIVIVLFLWTIRNSPTVSLRLVHHVFAFLLLVGACLVHGFIAANVNGAFDWARAVFSLMLIALAVACAAALRLFIRNMNSSDLTFTMRTCFAVFAVEGFLAVLGVPAIGRASHALPIIFFIEPSHYALAFTPFLLFEIFQESGARRASVVVISVAIALLVQSLTLLTAVLLAVTLSMRPRSLAFFALAVLPIFYFADFDYYLSRLDFGGDVENLSTLAFLQGWERAWLNLMDTRGVGVGFQQFGLIGDLGFYQERIEQLFDISINLQDGGTTGAKMVGEFGVLGVGGLVFYLFIVSRQLRRVRALTSNDTTSVHARFFASVLLAGLMELFVRGAGYMTPGMLFVGAGLLELYARRTRSTSNGQSRGVRTVEIA